MVPCRWSSETVKACRRRARAAAAQSVAEVIGNVHLPEVWRLYPEMKEPPRLP